MTAPARDAAVDLRAWPEQRDRIDLAAAMPGKDRSDFMLEAACERVRSMLLDQVFFRLDGRRFGAFMWQLDAPSAPNRGLERLMAVRASWQAARAVRKRARCSGEPLNQNVRTAGSR
ncbi:MAG: DUF1778 domain-containing protein [Gammaproteobacteria bacterium]|nr:DUF1778 domain-containing protein [Gammaproteobacteria bacterium]